MMYPVNSRRPVRVFAPALLLSVLGLAPLPSTRAGTFTYYPGTEPNGVWDATTLNWLTGSTPTAWPNTAADSAIFGANTGLNITLQATGITARDLTFNTDGYSFGGGSLTLGGAATSTVTLNPGVSAATFNMVLAGGFTKAGTGTVTLNGANTFTNGLTITGGAVSVAADNNLGAATSALTLNGGTLVTTASFNLSGSRAFVLGAGGGTLTGATGTTLTANGVISGTGALNLNGPGTVLLGGTNTFTGGVTVTGGGTLRVSSDSNFGNNGAITLGGGSTLSAITNNITANRGVTLGTGGAVLDVASGTTLTLSGVVAGTAGFSKTNAGTLTLSNPNNTYAGNTVVNGGALIISSDGNLGASTGLSLTNATLQTSNTFTLGATRTVTLGANSAISIAGTTLAVAGKVSGAGGLNKTGTGTLSLTGTGNDFGGNINVTGGTLTIAADGSLGAANNPINLNGGGLFQPGSSLTLGAGHLITLGAGGGGFNPASGVTLTIPSAIAGTSLSKQGFGTLTLGGTNTFSGGLTLTVGTLNFAADANLGAAAGALTLNGGVLTPTSSVALDPARGVIVNGSSTVNIVTAGVTLTVPGALSGSGVTLTKAGGGTLALTGGANTFSGPTVVSGGTLRLAGDNALNGGSLTINGAATVSLETAAGTPAGGGAVSIGTGTLLYAPAGAGTTAAVTVAGGAGKQLTYNSGSVLSLDRGSYTGSVALTLGPGAATADTSLVRGAGGALIIAPVDPTAGNATAALGTTGKILVNGGLTNVNGIVNPSIVVQNNTGQRQADFVRDAGGTVGLTSAAAGYTNATTATTTLAGTTAVENVTFAGTSTLSAAGQVYALRVGNGGTGTATTFNLGGNTLTVGNGTGAAGVILNGAGTATPAAVIANGTLSFNGAEAVIYVNTPGGTISGAVTGTGGLTLFGAGTLTLGAAPGLSGTVNVNTGATLKFSADNTLPVGSVVNLANGNLDLFGYAATFSALNGAGAIVPRGGTLTLDLAAPSTYGGVISGSGNLVKTGTATLTLGGASTFTGQTSILNGTVKLGGGTNRLSNASTLLLAADGTLDVNGSAQTFTVVTGAGAVVNTSASAGTLGFGAAGDFNLDVPISGNTGIVKNNADVVTLTSTANTFTGTTLVNAGTLRLGAAGVLPAATRLTVGAVGGTLTATFDLNGVSQTVAGLSNGTTTGARLITNSGTAPVTFTVFNDSTNGDSNYSYNGNLADGAGTIALEKTGSRNLTLTGANTYTGGTTVSGGTLTVNTAALPGNVLNNAALVFDQSANGTYAGTITGSGTLTKTNAGTLILTGPNAHTGGTTVSGGTLQGTTTTLPGNILDNAAVVFDQNATAAFAGNLSGTGTFTKANTGTLTLTGTNAFTGTYVAAGGTLRVGAATAVAANSQLTVGDPAGGNNAGTFDVNGNNVTVAGLSSGATTGAKLITNNGGTIATTFTVNNGAAAGIFAGTIQDGTGALALTKGGIKTLTLAGANPFTGATVVNAGTLQASAANALQNTASITVNTGATLEANAANAITSAGPIRVNNNGTLLLNGGTGTTNEINNAAPIILAGGSLTKGPGVSEGAGGSSSGAASAPGLGALTLQAVGSRIDFGTAAPGGTLVFAGFTPGAYTLNVDNWTGAGSLEGIEGASDRLIFSQGLSPSDLSRVVFTGYTLGTMEIALAGGYYEVVPVPEPGTWLAGALATAALGWGVRRRGARRLPSVAIGR